MKQKKTPGKSPDKKRDSTKNLRPKAPWKPGESGNPAGRPKGSRNYAKIMEEIGEIDIRTPKGLAFNVQGGRIDAKTALIMRLFSRAVAGDVRSAELIMDRVDGKPINTVQTIETNELPEWMIAMAPKPVSDEEVMNGDECHSEGE